MYNKLLIFWQISIFYKKLCSKFNKYGSKSLLFIKEIIYVFYIIFLKILI